MDTTGIPYHGAWTVVLLDRCILLPVQPLTQLFCGEICPRIARARLEVILVEAWARAMVELVWISSAGSGGFSEA